MWLASGRKVWSSLGAVSTSLARVIWLHVSEREGQLGKADLIDKINALNMVIQPKHNRLLPLIARKSTDDRHGI